MWIPDKPCGLSGMTAGGNRAACGGMVRFIAEVRNDAFVAENGKSEI